MTTVATTVPLLLSVDLNCKNSARNCILLVASAVAIVGVLRCLLIGYSERKNMDSNVRRRSARVLGSNRFCIRCLLLVRVSVPKMILSISIN